MEEKKCIDCQWCDVIKKNKCYCNVRDWIVKPDKKICNEFKDKEGNEVKYE